MPRKQRLKLPKHPVYSTCQPFYLIVNQLLFLSCWHIASATCCAHIWCLCCRVNFNLNSGANLWPRWSRESTLWLLRLAPSEINVELGSCRHLNRSHTHVVQICITDPTVSIGHRVVYWDSNVDNLWIAPVVMPYSRRSSPHSAQWVEILCILCLLGACMAHFTGDTGTNKRVCSNPISQVSWSLLCPASWRWTLRCKPNRHWHHPMQFCPMSSWISTSIFWLRSNPSLSNVWWWLSCWICPTKSSSPVIIWGIRSGCRCCTFLWVDN